MVNNSGIIFDQFPSKLTRITNLPKYQGHRQQAICRTHILPIASLRIRLTKPTASEAKVNPNEERIGNEESNMNWYGKMF